MTKGKVIIAIILAFVILAGVAGLAYCISQRDTDEIITPEPPDPPDNSEVLEALQRIIELLENGVQNQDEINKNIVKRFGELSERIDNDREDINGIILELENIFNMLYALESEIGEFESYDDTEIFWLYGSVLDSLSNLIKDNNVLAISHADLVRLYQSLQTVVDGLVNSIENMDFDLEAVLSDIRTLQQGVSGLQADYSTLANSLVTAQNLIDYLSGEFDIFRSDYNTLESTVAEILLALAALDGGGSSELCLQIQSEIAEVHNRITAHDEHLQNLQDAINYLDSDYGGRISNLENLMQTLEYTVNYLSTEIAMLSGHACPDYTWDFFYMNQRIDALETVFNSQFSVWVSNLEMDIWNLNYLLSGLESRIEELERGDSQTGSREILSNHFEFNPTSRGENFLVIPYSFSSEWAERDNLRITYGVFFDGGILITRVIDLQIYFIDGFPIISAMDGVSMLGVEWLLIASLIDENGYYILQFEMSAFSEFWDIAAMKILSIEYIQAVNG